ncbi:Hpt domain-containing protein [Aliivibrio fischeri]|uniref:Hpt domain-containing protein n=1 Tax=Aliivibrio fischeri TaxID=668 RepID=UPI0012D9BA20|nr:Hpt domain-containing protein [Aliivibrio fischeri]MUK39399.1 Hpt domain-containing protein [Aliivibrio fischeri]MUL07975.1 Hpt domain-containing protein [Aliivibrio fischeri]
MNRNQEISYIDKHVFLLATGVEYLSTTGERFREIAKKGLLSIQLEFREASVSNVLCLQLVHKLKSIVSSVGAIYITRICIKIEQYKDVLCPASIYVHLDLLLQNLISSLD